jgi:GNAT superfamily N-acetyltransferase
MEIREERRDDVVAVTDVHRAAFADRGDVVASLVAELRRVPSDDGLRLVVEQDGTVVGSVTFTVGLLDAPARLVSVQILSPLAVTPALQRRGIGAALIKRAAWRSFPPVGCRPSFSRAIRATTAGSDSWLRRRCISASPRYGSLTEPFR